MEKKYMNIRSLALCFLCLGLGFTFASCEDDNEPARTPVATCNVNKQLLEINESMEIEFTGVADQVVVFTGDEGHAYDAEKGTLSEIKAPLQFDENEEQYIWVRENTGIVMNKGVLTYSYSIPGEYHVVVIATTYDTYMGGSKQEAKYEFNVTVTDDCTTIDEISTTIQKINTFFAEAVDDVNWVLRLPTKQVYNGKEGAVAAKQRLSFSIASERSEIYVDGILVEPKDAKQTFDVTKNHDINVKANSGATRDYKLVCMYYPEFATVKIDGTAAKLVRDAYYQDKLTYTFDAPADLKNVVLDYTIDSDVKFYKNGTALASGSTIDLTADDTYTLERVSDEVPVAKAVCTVVFKVN